MNNNLGMGKFFCDHGGNFIGDSVSGIERHIAIQFQMQLNKTLLTSTTRAQIMYTKDLSVATNNVFDMLDVDPQVIRDQ